MSVKDLSRGAALISFFSSQTYKIMYKKTIILKHTIREDKIGIYEGDTVRVDFVVPSDGSLNPDRYSNSIFKTGVEMTLTIGEPSLWI